ncbi:MAG: hypothetical protein IT443_09325 [Phycisphaeraceae bacterium]|nr:hypothetical protein [Phycisphaeraceae bacterium]
MRMKMIVSTAMAACLLLLATSFAGAQPGNGPGGGPGGAGRGPGAAQGGPRGLMPMLFADVELTTEQRQQIREILREHHQAMDAWREEHKDELQPLRQELRDIRDDNKDSIKKMRDLHRKMAELLTSEAATADLVPKLDPMRKEWMQLRDQIKKEMQPTLDKIKEIRKSAPALKEASDKILATLTAEQKAVVEPRIKEWQAKMDKDPDDDVMGSPPPPQGGDGKGMGQPDEGGPGRGPPARGERRMRNQDDSGRGYGR